MHFSGVDEGTRLSSFVPFNINGTYERYLAKEISSPFSVGKLVSVEHVTSVKKEAVLLDGVTLEKGIKPTPEQVTPSSVQQTLVFKFESLDGVESHIETLWDLDPKDAKYDNKEKMISQKYGQVFEAYMGANTAKDYLSVAQILAKEKPSWAAYFAGIARIFNTAKEGGPIFLEEGAPIPVRLKLVRNRGNTKNPNSITLPLGNFIEKIVKGAKSSVLSLNADDEFHIIEKPKAANVLGNAGGGFGAIKTVKEEGWDNDDTEL